MNDDVITLNTQSITQWDGFRHYGYQRTGQFYIGHKCNALGLAARCNGHRESFWVKAYIEAKKYDVLIPYLCLQPKG
ncbi:hypothetical protein LB505_012854 [Fusarium chuoi]|nr:hypothetical protein LB505_012854 [Fusarium chuoi]